MAPTVTIRHLDGNPIAARSTEFVERKGLGHPDSICDGIAEAVSRRLSRRYLAEFGRVLHHNTDSVQLVPGSTAPAFGGGEVVDPIYVLLAGQATASYRGTELPVEELAVEAATEYLDANFPALPSDAVTFDVRIGESSPELTSLYEAGMALANDTSVGVGHAPPTETERVVAGLEPALRERIRAVGPDVKLLAWRSGERLRLTVAAAVVASRVADLDAYVEVTERVRETAEAFVTERTDLDVEVAVNAADDVASGRVYLTETGLSAEMGDGGNVGRGNRVDGLITPHRPMSLEAAAGKNPVGHVGKLYNLVAADVAERIHRDLGAEHAEVKLLSRIASPVSEPQAVDVDTTARDDEAIRGIVAAELAAIDSLTADLVAGERSVF